MPQGRTFRSHFGVLAAFILVTCSLAVGTTGADDNASGEARVTLKGHRDGIFSVGFAQKGQTVASASRDGTVRLFDVESGEQTAELKGHEGQVLRLALGGENLLPLPARTRRVRLWDLEYKTEIAKLEGHKEWVAGVAFSPDGRCWPPARPTKP